MYAVGIDIGTTYTAAAVWRDGRAEIVPLGSHLAAVPSVVFLRSDGLILTGESAGRRGLSEPSRVAREFKRRLGDTTSTLLGGTPYSAAALTARMLRSVLDTVAGREGGPPASICLTHPANWGPYKVDLLRQVIRLADVEQPVKLVTDAQAAATFHAHQKRLEPGATVAVYDLGGGTFDAAVLRKTADGFDIIGRPEGIERLGGIDFDAMILDHVTASVGGPLEQAGKDDPAVVRLREECVQAKEALSADTDTTIQVLLPTVSTEVRLTRSELEAMVRPSLRETVEALLRAVRSAGYSSQGLGSVLLLGGSSRMPIVARMVGEELGLPVAVDADPKLAVALGAAWQAGDAVAGTPPAPVDPWIQGTAGPVPTPVSAPADPEPEPDDEPTGEIPVVAKPAGGIPVVGNPAGGIPVVAKPASGIPVVANPAGGIPVVAKPASGIPVVANPAGEIPVAKPAGEIPVFKPAGAIPVATPAGQIPVVKPAGEAPAPGGAAEPPLYPKAGFTGRAGIGPAAEPVAAPFAPPPQRPAKTGRSRVPIAVAAATVLVLAIGGTAWAIARSASRDDTSARGALDRPQGVPSAVASAVTSAPAAAPAVPPDEQCTDEMKKSTRWVCLTKATLRGNTFTVFYQAEWNGSVPDIKKGFHLHMYGGDGTRPDESTMGSQVVVHSKYYFEDKQPSVLKTSDEDFTAVGDARKVCARIARTGHGLEKAFDGSYHTGNCIPIQRS